jgi:uncharacterized small protein (DUF1192 family)
MAETRPTLAAVPDSPGPSSDPTVAARRGVRDRWLVWVGIALLVIAVTALAQQTNRVGALEARVVGLGAELAASQASVAAYESRFVEIRTSVGDLQERLGALDLLVSEPPVPASSVAPVPAHHP